MWPTIVEFIKTIWTGAGTSHRANVEMLNNMAMDFARETRAAQEKDRENWKREREEFQKRIGKLEGDYETLKEKQEMCEEERKEEQEMCEEGRKEDAARYAALMKRVNDLENKSQKK